MEQDQLLAIIREKAPKVPVTLYEATGLEDAMAYAVSVAEKKRHCEQLLPKPGEKLGEVSENGFPTMLERYIAAPGISDDEFALLQKAAEGKDINLLRSGLRQHLGGFDVSITWAEALIADTLTCIVNSNREEVRIGTMIAEISLIFVRRSTILERLEDSAELLLSLAKDGPSYTAYITGPSRTADIERVGALGVHGPLELHVVLLEG